MRGKKNFKKNKTVSAASAASLFNLHKQENKDENLT